VLFGQARAAIDRFLVGLVVLAGISVLVEAPSAFQSTIRAAAAATRLSESARELAPERRVEVDGRALVRATRIIPPHAMYFVAASPVDAVTVRPMTFYVLFPRRYVDSPRRADWVLLFGKAPPRVPVRLGPRIRLGPGLVAARVRP
jgi:hypothetical protein